MEEAACADFLIHVIDASSPERDGQIETVERVLEEIGAGGKPVIGVYNKCDKLDILPIVNNKSEKNVFISAKNGENTDKLIEAVSDTAPGKKQRVRAVIPYSEGGLVNALHETEKVLNTEYGENGVIMELMVDAHMYGRIKEYIDV